MTTYGTLKSDVQSYMARTDTEFVAAIPTFIRKAEAKWRRAIIHSSMEVTSTLTTTGRSTPLPEGFLEARNISVATSGNNRTRDLIYMTPEVIRRSAYWDSEVSTPDPVAFTIEGSNLIIAPAVTDAVLDITYYKKFEDLVDDADTNWLLENAYDVALTYVLYEAAKWSQDMPLQQQYLVELTMLVQELMDKDQAYAHRGSAIETLGIAEISV